MTIHESLSRRALLLGLSAGTLQALQHAHKQVQSGSREFAYLPPAAAADLQALASAIVPSDGTPGAQEAGVIFFIDRALATFDQDKRGLYRDGLAAAQRQCRAMFPEAASPAALSAAQLHQLASAIDKTEFFEQLRTHTIIGFLATPEWGGNRGEVGWKLIGFENAGVYQPPFGYYDRTGEAK
jgi:gluconate 2-dehydrogenase gamma chain